ncbi:hypothetical protein [Occallatibacter savannae]|uniref:hypothetical protein n=1 Tax=Occallatibacter savannae TaxID=1002691 RepID=UPI0013A53DD0|nr:hypothetical protein [Occallatibacter savannae]
MHPAHLGLNHLRQDGAADLGVLVGGLGTIQTVPVCVTSRSLKPASSAALLAVVAVVTAADDWDLNYFFVLELIHDTHRCCQSSLGFDDLTCNYARDAESRP